jgi:hypothetical protein
MKTICLNHIKNNKKKQQKRESPWKFAPAGAVTGEAPALFVAVGAWAVYHSYNWPAKPHWSDIFTLHVCRIY